MDSFFPTLWKEDWTPFLILLTYFRYLTHRDYNYFCWSINVQFRCLFQVITDMSLIAVNSTVLHLSLSMLLCVLHNTNNLLILSAHSHSESAFNEKIRLANREKDGAKPWNGGKIVWNQFKDRFNEKHYMLVRIKYNISKVPDDCFQECFLVHDNKVSTSRSSKSQDVICRPYWLLS